MKDRHEIYAKQKINDVISVAVAAAHQHTGTGNTPHPDAHTSPNEVKERY